jgi:hypothetical protein
MSGAEGSAPNLIERLFLERDSGNVLGIMSIRPRKNKAREG